MIIRVRCSMSRQATRLTLCSSTPSLKSHRSPETADTPHAGSRQDAERPERRAHAEHGHDSQRAIVSQRAIAPHAPRGNALGDAPRHDSAPRRALRVFKADRRASGTVYPRGAWAR
ncbi:hypothetical protein ALO97_04862 [Pseudomonas syringae pv. tagetis]|nr:hypothetical protein ALP93_05414 [Pseudomonas syringae pv. helianthi]RMW15338.1 hypothetical protein ALO98_05094 [Pseudomonas syringae pv. tagetis]RMW21591.1 hypothetical protein ALO97_04862 [Pseudomonas syringae pv. tagetis]